MPSVDLSAINYVAVLVAALVTFFIGGGWYTALAKQRQAAIGYTDERMAALSKLRPPAVFLGGMLASYCVLAAIVAVLVNIAGVSSLAGGAFVGFLLWLGPAACIGLTEWIASDKKIAAYWIDAGCQLIYLILIGAVIGAWR